MRSQTGKIDVYFRNLDPLSRRLDRKRVVIPRKNTGLWVEFAFFEVNGIYKIIMIQNLDDA